MALRKLERLYYQGPQFGNALSGSAQAISLEPARRAVSAVQRHGDARRELLSQLGYAGADTMDYEWLAEKAAWLLRLAHGEDPLHLTAERKGPATNYFIPD